MMRRAAPGRMRALTAAVLGGGLLLGVPAAHAPGRTDLRPLPAAGSHALHTAATTDGKRMTLDRLDRDGGERPRVGATFHVRAGFTHHGEHALHQVAVSINLSERLSFATEYRNCEYGTDVEENPASRTHHQALCLIDTRVQPGESVDLAPVAVTVGKAALDEVVSVEDATGMGWPPYGKWRDRHRGRGRGKELTLVKRTGGVPPAARVTDGMSSGRLEVSVDNAWDLAVKGAAVKGRKGDTVTAKLSLDFHGADVKAQLDAENSIPFARVAVRLPRGVTVVSTPEHCGGGDPGKGKPYLCEYGLYTTGFDLPMLRDGFHRDYPFELRIDDTSELDGGMVRVDAPPERLRDDAAPENDTAPLTIEATGAAGGPSWTAGFLAAGAAVLVPAGLIARLRARRRAP
ncbi:hypothetical protein [Streptomyces sp. NPDC006193]|uniref:hypothetical protein n=1 Tax=Streptomyces sp. NPDC006193 TaxID=3155717 RepID=UPI0033B53F25